MAFFSKKKDEQIEVADLNLPSHIGIIMDGNGRWAKKRGLPRKAGHRQGAKTFRTITRYCSDIGIKYLTVYAFSTENWKRPQEEVDALMSLFKSYLNEALEDFKDDSIVVKFIGDIVEGPDGGDALAESYLLLEGIPLPNHLQQILRILGVLSPLGQGIIPGLKGLYIGAGIGKSGKFPVVVHDQSSLG